MAGSIGRSISIGLSANTKNFAKNLKSAEKNLERFKRGVKAIGTAVAASFAAMAAGVAVFGKMAIDAALEDQKAMKALAKTVANNTKVNAKYQHTVENTIEKLQDWYNVSDDKLRPAMSKLILATGSVSKSQKLMRTALDVSATTGKDLTTVAVALGKAYGGNTTALKRLGLGFTDAELKGKPFDEILGKINEKVSGAAAAAADTYAGKVEGLKIQWQEFLESVGYKLLPYVSNTLDFIKKDLIPFIGLIKQGFQGTYDDKFTPKVRAMARAMGVDPEKPAAVTLGESLRTMAESFGTLLGKLTTKGPGGASALDTIATALTNVANAMTGLADAASRIKTVFDNLPKPIKMLLEKTPNLYSIGKYLTTPKGDAVSTQASGGPVQAGRRYLVGENGPEMFVPSTNGGIRTAAQTRGMTGGTTVININGVVDADSARRSIEQVLRNSGKRIGPVDLVGSTL